MSIQPCWIRNSPRPSSHLSSRQRLFIFVILLIVGMAVQAFSQDQSKSPLKVSDIIKYLSETINWYHGAAVEQQIANEQSDLAFLNENRQISGQIVRLAFDFARAEEKNQSKQAKAGQAEKETDASSQYQRLTQAATSADLHVEQSQSELESLRKKLETTPEKKKPALEALITETESELAFQKARRDALHNILEFATESSKAEMGASGLSSQIQELSQSVPSALSGREGTPPKPDNTEKQISTKTTPSKNKQEPSVIWDLAADLFKLSHKKRILDKRLQITDQLIQTARQLRRPLVANLRSLIQSGEQLASQTPSNQPALLAQQKKQLDALTAQFKQASAELFPLGKQAILLNLYKRTVANWREAVRSEFNDVLRNFSIRLGILLVVVGLVFTAGEAWRRAIFRYIQEPRRRYQFLLFRKIIIWIALVTIVAFTFATKLGSVATFAGLVTAGVAVALQNVILSVAGYFFLMGKYGIRVGDRVQIAGVTGEVVDIGLVRLHLLELSSAATEAQPSGRVVAFSNSIVFQPTSGVFRKIPGTSFVWHEISLTFSLENNYRLIQERMTTAVDNALKDHRKEIEEQGRHMEQALNSISTIELKPKTHFHFTPSGIEVMVRFPVEVKNAVDIDDRMMRELYAAIDQEPKLKLAGIPTLRTEIPISTPS